MHCRRTSVGDISKLPGIGSGHKNGGEHHQHKDHAQNDGCYLLQRPHWLSPTKARPANSVTEFAASITRQTTRVTLTMRGKSRLSAACHASCPSPGESHNASMGIAVFFVMIRRPPR